jgi:hypothetical protein
MVFFPPGWVFIPGGFGRLVINSPPMCGHGRGFTRESATTPLNTEEAGLLYGGASARDYSTEVPGAFRMGFRLVPIPCNVPGSGKLRLA